MKNSHPLLTLARQTLEQKLNLPASPPSTREDFETTGGVFVTLKKTGTLRGCIGHIQSNTPYRITVAKMAFAAAFEDPRFPPLTPEEWPDITVEISLLSPMELLKDPLNEIEIGKDGLYLENGFRSGLLLPQVPVEENWNIDEFLTYIGLKAGLGPESWKNPKTRLSRFSARILREKD